MRWVGSVLRAALAGVFFYSAIGRAEVQFLKFEMVEDVLGNEGLIFKNPLPGEPPPGLGQVQGTLSGPIQSATFRLVDAGGADLEVLALSSQNLASGLVRFLGVATIPAQSFRATVSGFDGAAQPFTATFPRLFSPQLLVVRFLEPAREVTGGVNPLLVAEVTNLGAAATFALVTVASPATYLVSPPPVPVQIATGATAEVQIQTQVPKRGPPLETLAVTLSARSQSDTRTNGATAEILIVRSPFLFQDGFESEDRSSWSGSVP